MIEGWLRSRSTIRATRSTHADQVARVVGTRPRNACDSMSASSMTYSPSSSVSVEERRVVRVVRRPDGVEPEPLHRDDVGAHVLAARRPGRCAGRSRGGSRRGCRTRAPVDQQVDARGPRPAGTRSGRSTRSATAPSGATRRTVQRGTASAPPPTTGGRPAPRVARRTRPTRAARPAGSASRQRGDVVGRGQRAGGAEALEVDDVPPRRPGHGPVAGARRRRARAARRRHRRTAALELAPRPASPRPGASPANPSPTVERSVPVVRSSAEPGVDREVGEVRRAGRVQEHRARDAAVPPLVLVLDERRVGPLHDASARSVVRARPERGR